MVLYGVFDRVSGLLGRPRGLLARRTAASSTYVMNAMFCPGLPRSWSTARSVTCGTALTLYKKPEYTIHSTSFNGPKTPLILLVCRGLHTPLTILREHFGQETTKHPEAAYSPVSVLRLAPDPQIPPEPRRTTSADLAEAAEVLAENFLGQGLRDIRHEDLGREV